MVSEIATSVKAAELSQDINVLEDTILQFDIGLLNLLLKDKTTNRNIIWATTNYESLGKGYEEFSEITPKLITGEQTKIILPRITKSLNAQSGRIRDRAEVFTPSWICNHQNNLVDAKWFGRTKVFNVAAENGWIVVSDKVEFPNQKKTWKKYVDAQRLEITCGEAPYLVSRYDTVTGEKIILEQRIGLLDRKLRVINENTCTENEWLFWTKRAFQSVYGYEYQGDNLLLARKNLLCTFIDYYQAQFGYTPDIKWLYKIARIISWNIWQMDGMKFVVPNSCKPIRNVVSNLFGTEVTEESCPGCRKNDIHLHTGTYCRIQDWRFKMGRTFISMMKGGHEPCRDMRLRSSTS
jgi:hypothetical protein